MMTMADDLCMVCGSYRRIRRNETNKLKIKRQFRSSFGSLVYYLAAFASRSHMRTYAILLPGFPLFCRTGFFNTTKDRDPTKIHPLFAFSLSPTIASHIHDSRLSQDVEEGGKSPSTAHAGQKGHFPPALPWVPFYVCLFFHRRSTVSLI